MNEITRHPEHQRRISQIQHFIGGKFVNSLNGNVFANINPATGKKIADVCLGSKDEIQAAVEAAENALRNPEWTNLSFNARADLLDKIADKILANKESLAKMETEDTGKPLSETLNGDIPRAALNFKFFAQKIRAQPKVLQFESEDGSKHSAVREPAGICGLITPWNLPLYLETWKVAPALGMGNAVILKPAELTPRTASALAEIGHDCGLPAGVLNVVHGFGADGAGQALVEHPQVASISFTGETTTGTAIMQAASRSLKKLSFELGGKGASVIFADADLDKACVSTANSAFRNQGQICLANSRLLVEEKIAPQVVERLQRCMQNIVIGDPLDMKTTMGALISSEHREKVMAYVEHARHTPGHEILCGGKIPEHLSCGSFFEPTLIHTADNASRLIQEEIFGPVLTVQTFSCLEQASDWLNSTPYGLSCSVWSRSDATLDKMSKLARFGMVWLNSWFLRNLNTPFGGMKKSGIGREGGEFSLDFFSEWKTVSRP